MPHRAPLPLLPCSRAQVCELAYSKATSNPARWVLAVLEDSPVQRPEELAGTIVASELVNTTKKWVSTTLAVYNPELCFGFSLSSPRFSCTGWCPSSALHGFHSEGAREALFAAR